MDRRALFFLATALVVAALIPVTDEQYRLVPTVLAVVYLILALVSYLDFRSRRRDDSAGEKHP